MNFDNCQIYKGKKRIGILPCKFIKKTDLYDEYFLISNTYRIKPGYILVIDNKEKFYVTDVRLIHNDTRLRVFFETVAQHKNNVATNRKVNLSLVIAFASFIVSTIALIKSFFPNP